MRKTRAYEEMQKSAVIPVYRKVKGLVNEDVLGYLRLARSSISP